MMTRSRITFFVVLGIVMAIVAMSLTLRLISDGAIVQLFIATTIFSVGVVALDFLGILGGEDGDGAGDGNGAFDADGDVGLDLDSLDGDGGGDADGIDADIDIEAGHTDTAHLEHQANPVLSVLAYLRLFVYFCLGFGPTGWAGMLSGRSALTSLLLAVPVGVIALYLAQAFFRFQRSNTDSSLTRGDLINARATVTIPLTHKTMGKVRVQVGMTVVEQYALATDSGQTFAKGDTVRVARVTDECVYVA